MNKHKFNIFPEMVEEEFSKLVDDINIYGYDENRPITTYEGEIIDGWNRYKACEQLGVEATYTEFTGTDKEAVLLVLRSNKRRNLSSSQWAAIAVDSEEIIQVIKDDVEAEGLKKRKENYTNQYKAEERGSVQLIVPTQKDTSKLASSKVAEIFNTNRGYISDAQKFRDENPETFAKIRSGELTISSAKKEERKGIIEKQIEALNDTEIRINGKYDVIVIDPPWNYGREYDPESSRVANPYPEMDFNQLSELEIPAEENCVMWLWTTQAFIWDAKKLLEEWGFEYKAMIVWDKQRMGMGHWLRMQTEFCLLAIKGKPIWELKDVRDIISEPRREHSRKPEVFYNMVKRLPGKKIDYFSREQREGFDTFGNDTKKFTNEMG